MEEPEKYVTSITFKKPDSSRLISGQARIEGFSGMGEFIEHIFEKFMEQKKEK